jgi:hypothetical protein
MRVFSYLRLLDDASPPLPPVSRDHRPSGAWKLLVHLMPHGDQRVSIGIAVAARGVACKIAKKVKLDGNPVGRFNCRVHQTEPGTKVATSLEERRDFGAFPPVGL